MPKKETSALIIALLVTGAVVVTGGLWFANTIKQSDRPDSSPTTATTPIQSGQSLPRLSGGEAILISDLTTPQKQKAVDALKSGNYQQAIQEFEASLAIAKNDPEALIYLNNARIGQKKSYTIVASMPIGNNANAAKEMLRGVAQAQDEINREGGINGTGLKVLIANDDNDEEIAQQVAAEFVKKPEILGVVGHFGSGTTLAAATTYQQEGLPMISPTSTSVALSGVGNYIFRTVPSDRFAGSALARYQLEGLKKQKAAVFFNSESNYSQSLKDVFTTDLFGQGGEVVAEYDFSAPDFDARRMVQEAGDRGAEVLMLAANSEVLEAMLAVVAANQGKLSLLAGDSAYKPDILARGAENALGMVLAVPWHILGNPGSEFPQAAQQLWGGDVNWRTAMAYDATRAFIEALKQNPTRSGIQKAFAQPQFQATGATGDIRFLPSGDRNQAVQLVEVKVGTRSGFSYDFVPVE
ncbi:ABC transporter substrate-binding protein [Spirulina sp. 06S082]|uniref:ABC transporter substrate-binding protein n=1 Tax=Spirulina sp. 06S082 TaxID=3110248 RepID=UPI002B1FC2B8|nr:ABC transporter substrate-binding protein [Spirulina sp. 06S082]MEA5471911.1 ABC transporter substrate-binding protein [Spirulina sp. 06S082]